MCILALSINNHSKYKFILASNRDEFYNRETKFAKKWNKNNIIAGRDLKKGGTWLGISSNNRFSVLTNYRNPTLININYKSRGMLVLDYLNQNISIRKWRKNIKEENYNPFNIILGNFNNLFYYSNINDKMVKLDSGIHTLSNTFMDEYWPKTNKLKFLFDSILKTSFTHSDLIKMMQDEEKFPIERLPNTNISREMEYFLSPIFINSKKYGTRATTIITVDYNDNISFTEVSYNNEKQIINKFIYEL